MAISSIIILICALISFALVLVSYVVASMGLYHIALTCNTDIPWLAWIPIAQLYLLGVIIKKLYFSNYEIPHPHWVLPAVPLTILAFGGIPVLGILITVIGGFIILLALYRLFFIFKHDSALAYTLLSIIPLVGAFLIFSVSKNNPEY